jgi:hypothetical protein
MSFRVLIQSESIEPWVEQAGRRHFVCQIAAAPRFDMLRCDVHKGRQIASSGATKCNGLAAPFLLLCKG